MASRTKIFLLTVWAVLVFACPAISAPPAKIGVLGNVQGTATATGADAVKRTLKAGDDIFQGDTIRTDENSNAQILFLDKSALSLTPGSEVKMDSFVYDPTSSQGEMSIEEAKGAFRFIGGALSKQNHVEIKTPVSTIGIRGGIEETHVTPEGDDAEAIFVYGHDMTVQDKSGKQIQLTEFGGGAHVKRGGNGPERMTAQAVSRRFKTFSRINAAPGRMRRAFERRQRGEGRHMEERRELRGQRQERGREERQQLRENGKQREDLRQSHDHEGEMKEKRQGFREKRRERMKERPEHPRKEDAPQ